MRDYEIVLNNCILGYAYSPINLIFRR